jgi:hypothetical protein
MEVSSSNLDNPILIFGSNTPFGYCLKAVPKDARSKNKSIFSMNDALSNLV